MTTMKCTWCLCLTVVMLGTVGGQDAEADSFTTEVPEVDGEVLLKIGKARVLVPLEGSLSTVTSSPVTFESGPPDTFRPQNDWTPIVSSTEVVTISTLTPAASVRGNSRVRGGSRRPVLVTSSESVAVTTTAAPALISTILVTPTPVTVVRFDLSDAGKPSPDTEPAPLPVPLNVTSVLDESQTVAASNDSLSEAGWNASLGPATPPRAPVSTETIGNDIPSLSSEDTTRTADQLLSNDLPVVISSGFNLELSPVAEVDAPAGGSSSDTGDAIKDSGPEFTTEPVAHSKVTVKASVSSASTEAPAFVPAQTTGAPAQTTIASTTVAPALSTTVSAQTTAAPALATEESPVASSGPQQTTTQSAASAEPSGATTTAQSIGETTTAATTTEAASSSTISTSTDATSTVGTTTTTTPESVDPVTTPWAIDPVSPAAFDPVLPEATIEPITRTPTPELAPSASPESASSASLDDSDVGVSVDGDATSPAPTTTLATPESPPTTTTTTTQPTTTPTTPESPPTTTTQPTTTTLATPESPPTTTTQPTTTTTLEPLETSTVKNATTSTTSDDAETRSNEPTTEESVSTTEKPHSDSTVVAVTASIAVILCLLLIFLLIVVIRRRRARAYQGTCQPARMDAYSLDNVSPSQTWLRGKLRSTLRASKRSYLNQAFDDPVAFSMQLTAAQLALYMEKPVSSIESEFSRVANSSTVRIEELPAGVENKNRYANVLPIPETRVRIRLRPDCNVDDTIDNYINANYVRGPKQESKYYVACQGPLESTVADFWQMVWENQCRTIIQLTDLSENGVARCSEYLPPSEVLDCHRLYGDYQVTLKSRELKDHYVVSYIQLKCIDDNLIRELTHLWYTGWPSTGVPSDVKSVVALLLEARKGLSSSSSVKDHQPVVVHCSPGTGRTGAVLAIDTCLKQLDSSRGVDVPRCVHGLRQDRAGSVQTKEQYVFIYRAVNYYASQLSNAALDSL